jgi:hypothetical protein
MVCLRVHPNVFAINQSSSDRRLAQLGVSQHYHAFIDCSTFASLVRMGLFLAKAI